MSHLQRCDLLEFLQAIAVPTNAWTPTDRRARQCPLSSRETPGPFPASAYLRLRGCCSCRPTYSPQFAAFERAWKLTQRLATHNRYVATLPDVLKAVSQRLFRPVASADRMLHCLIRCVYKVKFPARASEPRAGRTCLPGLRCLPRLGRGCGRQHDEAVSSLRTSPTLAGDRGETIISGGEKMTVRAMTSELEGRIADAIGWRILIANGIRRGIRAPKQSGSCPVWSWSFFISYLGYLYARHPSEFRGKK